MGPPIARAAVYLSNNGSFRFSLPTARSEISVFNFVSHCRRLPHSFGVLRSNRRSCGFVFASFRKVGFAFDRGFASNPRWLDRRPSVMAARISTPHGLQKDTRDRACPRAFCPQPKQVNRAGIRRRALQVPAAAPIADSVVLSPGLTSG